MLPKADAKRVRVGWFATSEAAVEQWIEQFKAPQLHEEHRKNHHAKQPEPRLCFARQTVQKLQAEHHQIDAKNDDVLRSIEPVGRIVVNSSKDDGACVTCKCKQHHDDRNRQQRWNQLRF